MQDTTLRYQIKMQNYAWGLRQQLGYPLFAPANDCTAFASGGVADLPYSLDVSCLATQMRKDIVYMGWKQLDDPAPADVALALRAMLQVDWIDRLYAWASNDTSPVVLVSRRRDEHFAVGDRGLLERRLGKPGTALARGKRLAARRIARAAATMANQLAANNLLLPRGAKWQEPPSADRDTIVRIG